ncbi:archease [Mizugakiibacter sediminis]|uniref:Archease n=1 Tax=Mizugakiibacter sediminis TaxID=1475481 RepID=A0A0K8QQ83_9GAMM|nr:archease [Mizugakiibacter sediminis]GAP67038.1 archease [Mizugakiibacter sediminis]
MGADYDYFDHDADIGVVGRGASLEQAFEAAAAAMFAIMADPAAVRPAATVRIEFDETDPELALVTWLNRLLAEARTRGLALSRFRLHRDGGRWSGEADGQPWHAGIVPGTEVKGATLTGLRVGRVGHDVEARCVVDV